MFPGTIGTCVHVLLHHIRCARDWEQNSLVIGPLSGAGKTDTGYCLPFSLFFSFLSQGDDTGNDAETWKFCSTSSVGSSALQIFMLVADFHVNTPRVPLPALWSFGSCLGSRIHEATRVLLVATHVYNQVDRLIAVSSLS